MIPFSKARMLAETWVRTIMDGEAELLRRSTIAKPYGWVFFYQSSEYIRDPDNHAAALAGNGPIMIDRINGEVRVLGTGRSFEKQLTDYERSVPPAWLQMRPEEPSW